jgi:magnesium-transporting ATPase (P-type)
LASRLTPPCRGTVSLATVQALKPLLCRRVLAVAEAGRPCLPDAAGMERGLRLLGLIAILDPPRPAPAATIASYQAAGITPVLITGDHPATARAIARDLGIVGDDAKSWTAVQTARR